MLLLHPPVSKPCEPPAGISRLCGFLEHRGIKNSVLDANLEGLHSLFRNGPESSDTWSRRAFRHLPDHLTSLKSWKGYRNPDQYRRAVNDINRLLDLAARAARARIGLANYASESLSPQRSADLVRAAENPEGSPFFPYFGKRLPGLVDEKKPSVIGLSLNFLSQALTALAIIGFLRREYPGLPVVLGGGLVTSWLRAPTWKDPFGGLVDQLVAGPGEKALSSICKRAMGAEDERASEDFGTPQFDSFPMRDYFSPGPILPYSASSGCYWSRCAFCPERAEGNRYQPIPTERVITEIHSLVKQIRPVLIHILDNAISPALLKAMAQDPPGAPWYGFARITRDLADLDFCVTLRRSGCVMLQLGVESGDQAVLDRMDKGIDLGLVSAALKTLKKAGIATYVYLLFGTPWEAREEAEKTLEFTSLHHEEIDFLNVALFNLPVHSTESAEFKTESFYEGDLCLYTDFRHPRGWDRKKVRQFLDKEFKRDPAIASILRRDPPVFTSNHAPMFIMARSDAAE
jgi:radical SAM superfamily enzyme YgiQ (UPF0313 family)